MYNFTLINFVYPNLRCLHCLLLLPLCDGLLSGPGLFVCVDALRPSQQFFSNAGTISCLLGLNR